MLIFSILHKLIDYIERRETGAKSKEEAEKIKEEKMWAEYVDLLDEYYLNAPDDEGASKTQKLINKLKFHYKTDRVLIEPLIVPLLMALAEVFYFLFKLIELINKQ
jgi:hypothetical protein